MIIILYDTNRLKETEPVPLICIVNLYSGSDYASIRTLDSL